MIELALVFAGLIGVALALLTARRLPLWPRLVLIACVPWLAFAVWQAAQPLSGWPSPSKPPQDAAFKWASVREPDQLSGDKGEIDLWLQPGDAVRPRAYQLPYSRQLHEQVQAALDAVKHGQRLRVARPKPGVGSSQSSPYLFYREPPPQLPRKHA